MERSEKPLVPEWLKAVNGGTSGGGGVAIPPSLSSSQSDRIPSSILHRSASSNGAMMHEKNASGHSRPYINFSRSHCERHEEEDFDFCSEDHDFFASNTLPSRKKKYMLKRSQSMISGKRGEVWPRRAGNGPDKGGNITGNTLKSDFEREFPSLGTEDKHGIPDTGRVLSHGLSSVSQSMAIGASAVTGGEVWTSALARLPATVVSNDIQSTTQHAASNTVCVSPTTTTGLNMAETVAQAPARTRNTPQLSIDVQRLEELAIKQSRQLIPMTPSVSKSSVFNSFEKLKSKTSRSSDVSTVTKLGQQPPSQLASPSVRGNTRSDISKTSVSGKLTFLNAAREKVDGSTAAKEGQSLISTSRISPVMVPSATVQPLRNPVNPKLATDSRPPPLLATKDSMDKRSLSQSRNRIDFFNSIRKKSSANHVALASDSTSSVPEKSSGQITDLPVVVNKLASAANSVLEPPPRNGGDMVGDVHENSEIDLLLYARFPEEEELILLRSMGWEENAEEPEPITEEEITAFCESLKSRPPSKLSQEKILKFLSFGLHIGNVNDTSTQSAFDTKNKE